MIVITPGEPAGIGPDLVVLLAQKLRAEPWAVIADADMLRARAGALHVPLTLNEDVAAPSGKPGELTVIHTPLQNVAVPGKLDTANVAGVLNALNRAIDGCLQGQFSGMVTGPMQKSVVNEAGIVFSGHTEYLAEASGVDDVVMLLVAGELRVALATTHLALKDVPAAITEALLTRRLRIFVEGLRSMFGIAEPRLLVAGLNPHAGESGHLGREEIDIIAPAVARLQNEGIAITGPLAADTLFTPQYLDHADGVMAMYHDQGLPVLKYAGFGRAVNVTLGLPFLRTSVDHGTALDLAGSGNIDTGSMVAALDLASAMDRE